MQGLDGVTPVRIRFSGIVLFRSDFPAMAVIATVAGEAMYFSIPASDMRRIELLLVVEMKRLVPVCTLSLHPKQGPQLAPDRTAPALVMISTKPSFRAWR